MQKFLIHKNKIVNLDNVSLVSMDESKNRLIFNIRNSIALSNNYWTSDFLYFDYEDEHERLKLWNGLSESGKFITNTSSILGVQLTELINPDCVTNIKILDKEIIFNLDYFVTMKVDFSTKEIAKGIKWVYRTEEEVNEQIKMILSRK